MRKHVFALAAVGLIGGTAQAQALRAYDISTPTASMPPIKRCRSFTRFVY